MIRMVVRSSLLTLTVFGIGVFLASTMPAQAADLKIGYIDSERIFRSYQGTSDAQSKLDQEVTEWEKRAEEMRLRCSLLVASEVPTKARRERDAMFSAFRLKFIFFI